MSIHATLNSSKHLKTPKGLFVLVFIAVFISACNSPQATTLLYKDESLASSELMWSPDGKQIALSTNHGVPPATGIYLFDVQNKKISKVIDEDSSNGFHLGSWTPDSKKLALNASSLTGGIWLIDLKNTNSPIFMQDNHIGAWLPNEEKVIVKKNIDTKESSIYIDETLIFSSEGIGISQVSTSLDGSKLVFQFEKTAGANYGIYVFDQTTQKVTQITPDGNFTHPSFSPDGNMIAYIKSDNTGLFPANVLYIMKSDGSCSIKVPGHLNVFSPVWSPDGKNIAYISPNDRGIYLLDLAKAFGKDILTEGLPCS